MSSGVALCEAWCAALQEQICGESQRLNRAHVVHETDSTQDEARRINARPGTVVTTLRQRAGRGRLGRVWADTADDGIAVTFVLRREERGGERLAIIGAVAAANAAEAMLGKQVGIKWPNDILIGGRKLAGVLIEQVDEVALMGVGMNVSQMHWPGELARSAVSMHQLDAAVERLHCLIALVRAVDAALGMSDEQLVAAFAARDVLVGCEAAFSIDGRTLRGTVQQIDPMRGVMLNTADGPQWLPAALATLTSYEHA